MRTKLLLERPVPRIEIKQRHNTLLANFWGDEIDVDKEGKVIDRTVVDAQRLEGDAKKRRRPKKNGIVVGIDFGNTFTAVSYAHQNDGEMIDIVKWPKQVSAYSKVPTVSLYKADKDRTFEDWGSSALASYKRSKTDRFLVQDYKILLFDQGARGQLQHGLHLTDAFIHYLRSVHRHILEEINKSQVVAAESVPIHYCITIPQSWTLPTRELVLRCYVEAGVIIQTPAVNMTVITEAEAAATYCREHCAEFETLEDKDTFIVCDAGGMTTHVTVFQVDDSLGVRQFMRLSSSHAENCGSVILDWNFKALVLERLAGIDIDAKPQRQKALETLLEGFTEIKCQFDASAVDEIKHVAVPLGLDVNELDPAPSWLEDEYMSLTGQELSEKVFDPVVTKVQLLIEEQLKNHPICAGLFLVGGLGSSKYLSHRLKTLLPTPLSESQPTSTHGRSSTSSRNGGPPAMLVKNVIMVQKAELAVARGAVIYGLKSASQHNKAFQ
ncbi:hypothetical protein BGZ83_009463 [Gryganskiella cystojenkinii]|nr:hypothetical protein BGZ83_009463 [Gryganskiella cystojenkinii]